MNDCSESSLPDTLLAIEAETVALGFAMPSERSAGSLLRTLTASKPGGRLLELGTGTGLATAWLLDGMDTTAHLTSIDNDPRVSAIAKRYLGHDKRLDLTIADASQWLRDAKAGMFDLIFADAMQGKYTFFDQAWRLLKKGGLYVVDDMLPQPNWPSGHQVEVNRLLAQLDARADAKVTRLGWASGIAIAARI